MERTLIICKPDAVERRLVGEIIARFERKGLQIVAAELRLLSHSTLTRHYQEHQNKPFYGDLLKFMSRGPAFVVVVEGAPGLPEVVRDMVGATNPLKAAAGTIRGDFGNDLTENLIHASDSAESATREISLFFPDLDNATR